MLEPWAFRHKAWKKVPYFHLFENKFLNRARTIFATGDLETENLKKLLPRAKVSCIPLGLNSSQKPDYLNARTKLGWRHDEKIILYLSRIHPKKGLIDLVKSLFDLKSHLSERVRLVVVGDGDVDYLNQIQKFISENKNSLPPIDIVGPVWGEEKWQYLQGADLFCLPTYSENFGLAVLEAAFVGTPVLTTDQTPWLSHKNDSGFIITEPGIKSLKDGLDKFLKLNWSLTNRESFASDMKQKYSWETLAPKYLECFVDAL